MGQQGSLFLVPGAEAFKRDNPNAKVHLYDTGHFALETHYLEIAGAIRDSCGRKLAPQVRAA
jgi:hypothetical protein